MRDPQSTPAPVAFAKAHGTGNDFVLLPDPDDALDLDAVMVRALCDRHRGLGGDGVIRLAPGGDGADVFMDYRNADGSTAEMCGNGVRCVAKHVADRAPDRRIDHVRVGSRAGTKRVDIVERDARGRATRFRVDMGAPEVLSESHRLTVGGEELTAVTVSMGNPHAVLVVDDVDAVPLERLGPEIGAHPDFPEGTNVEVIAAEGAGAIAGRIWERGVGETLSSGTGASAMGVAACVRGLADPVVDVRLPGGVLEIAWVAGTLWVTGPADEVASGQLDPAWWEAAVARVLPAPAARARSGPESATGATTGAS